jgi:hypothetical protein
MRRAQWASVAPWDAMPSALRAKVSLVSIFAVLLIPIYTSSLRGLTHVLTCDQVTDADFSVVVDDQGRPSILSSVSFDRNTDRSLCGGLTADFAMGSARDNRADVLLTIANNTEFDWQGSIALKVDDTTIPVSIGRVPAQTTRHSTVTVRLRDDRDYELKGSLLIGP